MDSNEMDMVPVMVVQIPVMSVEDKNRLREEIKAAICDGLLLIEDGLSYGKTPEHEVQLPSAEERLSALEAAMLAMMGGAGHV